MDIAKILVELAKQSPKKSRKRRRRFKKKKPMVVKTLTAKFTPQQIRDLTVKILTETKKRPMYERLFFLITNPDIKDLAGKLKISPDQLEREYKLYQGECG